MNLKNLVIENEIKSLSGQKWNSLRQSILKRLLEVDNSTIAELSFELQSSVPTITKAINELLTEGYLIDLGKVTNSGGRRPSLFTIASDCAYFLGVEIGRKSVSIGLQNIKNEFVSIDLEIDYVLENNQVSLDNFCNLLNSFIEDSSILKEKIFGVCINLSGRVNSIEGFSNNYFFSENRPLTEMISEKISLDVFIENDSRAMAYGEFCEGVVEDEINVLFLNYSYGVGLGIISNGELYYGKSGYSGEFGHSSIFDNDVLCHCGKMGCLETEISGWALVEQFKKEIDKGRKTKIELPVDISNLRHQDILQGALKYDDALCVEIISNQAHKMGRYLSILLNIFNPELLVIGGDFSLLGDLVLLPIQSSLRKHSLGLVNRDVKQKKSTLSKRAGVTGACWIVKEKKLLSLLI